MARRTFVYIDGIAYERGVDEVPQNPCEIRSQLGDGALWGDRHYDGMRTTDGIAIDSRSKHREYMRRTGLTTADDFKGQWEQDRKVRDDMFTTGGDHRARRDDVGRAVYEVMERNRRK